MEQQKIERKKLPLFSRDFLKRDILMSNIFEIVFLLLLLLLFSYYNPWDKICCSGAIATISDMFKADKPKTFAKQNLQYGFGLGSPGGPRAISGPSKTLIHSK